ncbi:MAG: DNA/RNA non-specific endonuclease [Sandarakinorhabdus sp.]
MQRELRYGAPVCDQILTGRYFSIGYSWYFRQAKWALEIVDPLKPLFPDRPDIERLDNFRVDPRIPPRFRAGLNPYKGSGYDRGHLAASANQDMLDIQNSETFLMSNMSPMLAAFNRGIWSRLESAVRDLSKRKDILEVYVLTCPVFFFDQPVLTLGSGEDRFGIDVPIPHAFIKSVLAENRRGVLGLWTFEMKNTALQGELGDYLVKTYDAEQLVGGRFWDRVSGSDLHSYKEKPGTMWRQ